ncbi:hypothetical protein CVT25_005324 [Psilocybe cyanescens]|uniref:Uncharacterized protein n=1 Tax=Psilocybe cyanescens TaxID=93625 RepID=A0A409VPP7_PSICY|nr:hypothetical protein CVT25_005324 [Psilocybe cyanescens]
MVLPTKKSTSSPTKSVHGLRASVLMKQAYTAASGTMPSRLQESSASATKQLSECQAEQASASASLISGTVASGGINPATHCPKHGLMYEKSCANCEFRARVVPNMAARKERLRAEAQEAARAIAVQQAADLEARRAVIAKKAAIKRKALKKKRDTEKKWKRKMDIEYERYDAGERNIAHRHPPPAHTPLFLLDPDHPVSIAAANYTPMGVSCLPAEESSKYDDFSQHPCYTYSSA